MTGGHPPHIYQVAASAFKAMIREGRNQSLVVSGESGAGKTETTKKALQLFSSLAAGSGIEERVLEVRSARACRLV
jgi:myosin-5